MKRNSLAAAAAALALMPATAAPAAEVTVLCSNALKSVLEELAPRFEQATAHKPDRATTAAFKRALIEAKSIAYSEQGLTGRYLESLFQRLGVAAELKAKTRNGRGAELVGQGEAEIGMTQVSEILPVAGVELAGPLPPELQHYTVFPAAVGTAARQADAARALLTFLATPDAARVMQAKGLQPPARP